MMLNRRHIRVKVMQTIYAYKRKENEDLSDDEKFLMQSIENMYSLYLLLISLILEIRKRTQENLKKKQKKHLATLEDKNPNKKFENNLAIKHILQNDTLLSEIKHNKLINWDLDSEYAEIIFKEVIKSDIYKDYIKTRTSDFKEDKDFFIDLYKEVIAPNEKLYEYIEDKNLTWLDDLPTVNTTILKLIRKLTPKSLQSHFSPDLYKDKGDKNFAIDLMRKTILNSNALDEEIVKKTKNWETDRIASLDYILLKMGICELQYFSSIPIKVSINEYLEIAKEYSTPKSSIFINGILDKLVKEYNTQGKLNKIGRGLM